MNGLDPTLFKDIQETLLRCDHFQMNRVPLKAIFVDERISLWRDKIPIANDSQGLVQSIIDWLWNKTRSDTSENGLVLLLQVLQDNVDPNDQLHDKLGGLINRLTSPMVGKNPYRGLRKFTKEQADYFYGRTQATQQLVQRVDQIVGNTDQPNLLAVLGPSGSGKSSLVLAGLLPTLERGDLPNFPNMD